MAPTYAVPGLLLFYWKSWLKFVLKIISKLNHVFRFIFFIQNLLIFTSGFENLENAIFVFQFFKGNMLILPNGLEANRSPPVVTDDPPKSLRWTTEVASAAFAVATGGPPVAHWWNYFVVRTILQKS